MCACFSVNITHNPLTYCSEFKMDFLGVQVKFAKDGSSRDSAAPSPAPSVDSLGASELIQPLITAPPTNKPR